MIQDQAHTFIFFGQSGSGKGTQARLLLEYLKKNSSRDALYVETGAKMRELAERGTYTSKLVRQVMGNGGLMPEFIPVWLWTGFFIENYSGEEHLVLDGLSRRLHEAPILDSALDFYDIKMPIVLFLNMSRKRAFQLMKGRGRADDTDEYINNRLDWFEENVVPAINYFRDNPRYAFFEINGEQGIEEVHSEIIEKVFSAGR